MKTVLSVKRSRTDSGNSLSHRSSSADAIASNDDLLTEILLRLPIKSLVKFKSVSKHWFSLISNPHFFRHRNPLDLFFHRVEYFDFVPLDDGKSGRAAPFTSLTFINDPSQTEILQSCNGLLCCLSVQGNWPPRHHYHIFNPTTKQYTTIPVHRSGFKTVYSVSLAFDPSKSPHYKVVCVGSRDSSFPCYQSFPAYQINIYSSETGSWWVSADPFMEHIDVSYDVRFKGGVFWNGAIHWINTRAISLCFDVEQEHAREMPMPPIPDRLDDEWRVGYFGESRGHLHFVGIYSSYIGQFDVYEMRRDYSGWFVKYCVNLDTVKNAFPEVTWSYPNRPRLHFNEFAILCLLRGETDQEESCLVLHIPSMAILYNLKDKNFKKLCDFAPARVNIMVSSAFGWSSAYQYFESLSNV